ncbi:transposase [Shinella sp. BE166]
MQIFSIRAKCKWRNRIERLFKKLKNLRHIATDYEKAKQSYFGFVAITAVRLWTPFVN